MNIILLYYYIIDRDTKKCTPPLKAFQNLSSVLFIIFPLHIPEKQHNRPEGTACRSASNGMPLDK